jgi:hypothetical protein
MQQWNVRHRRASANSPAYSDLAALPQTAQTHLPRRGGPSPRSLPTHGADHQSPRLRLITRPKSD